METQDTVSRSSQDAVSRSSRDIKRGILYLVISGLLLLTVYILAGPAGLGGLLIGILGILLIISFIGGLFYLIRGLVKKR